MSSFLPLLAQDAGSTLTTDQLMNFGAILPEYFLCGMVIVMLLIDLFQGKGGSPTYPWISLGGILVAAVLVFTSGTDPTAVGFAQSGEIADVFSSVTVDGLAKVFKLIFLGTAALTVLFIARSGETYAHEGEFQVILFGALAGMCFLAGATDMVTFYLSFEMVSYTGFLMAGYRLYSTRSAEAATKYVIFGSVSSAVMLFGLTFVYGFTGSLEFGAIAEKLLVADAQPALIVAAIFVFGGFAFKAAAFPFQFWCPDVYEGSPAPIAGFLAVASKAAAFAIGLRVLLYGNAAEAMSLTERLSEWFNVSGASITQNMLIIAAIGSMTWGNLAALRQTNVQRMLAYSSIAHAGYLLMTCVVVGQDVGAGTVGLEATQAIVFYLFLYLFMTLGSFFIVTLMRRDLGSAELSSLRGMAKKHPVLAICFMAILFSLTGLPPTAGFLGKFMLFAPVIEQGFYLLAVAGLLNGAVSLYYYAQPIREMFLKEQTDESAPTFRLSGMDLGLVVALTVPLVALIFFGWEGMMDLAGTAVAGLGR